MTATESTTALDKLCVDTIRTLSMDAVQKANSGHPGTPMALAPIAYLLYARVMRHKPRDPDWPDRDRFILSAGHASMLLYSMLYLTGYDLSLDDLKQFRQWGSITPGHPERGLTPGVEMTTGPLGQGFANGVGMAIAEAYLAATFNRPGYEIFDHHVYGIVSDGDLEEGIASAVVGVVAIGVAGQDLVDLLGQELFLGVGDELLSAGIGQTSGQVGEIAELAVEVAQGQQAGVGDDGGSIEGDVDWLTMEVGEGKVRGTAWGHGVQASV